MDNINLKAYLANVGMTMTQFCNLLDCNRSYMSSISSGKTIPGRRLARDIFNATNGVIQLKTKADKSDNSKTDNNQCQNCG